MKRLSVGISPAEPGAYELPEQCPSPDCEGKCFALRQEHCAKALPDDKHEDVKAQRYLRLRCGWGRLAFLTSSTKHKAPRGET